MKSPTFAVRIIPETSRDRTVEFFIMKRTLSLLAVMALNSGIAIGQTAGASTSTGGSGGASTNPLLGGTGTYGTAAQGSTTGGGAYSVPNPNTGAIDESFRRLDRNGDGVLSMDEFRAGYARPVGGGATPGAVKKRSNAR